MPNRLLRDGILTSEKVNLLSAEEEVFYRRLISIVDDYGRYYAHPQLLRASCYPLKLDTVTNAHVEQWLNAVEKVGLVHLYTDSDDKQYLVVDNFNQRIRSNRSKFPAPEDCLPHDSTCPQSADTCLSYDSTPPQSADTCQQSAAAFDNLSQAATDCKKLHGKTETKTKTETETNAEHRSCSVLLRDRILQRRQQKVTDRTLESWDREVRLMIERDGRSIEDIKALINECHDMQPTPSGFTWRDNILSMGTLREKWNDGKIYVGMVKERVVPFPGRSQNPSWVPSYLQPFPDSPKSEVEGKTA